MALMECGWLGDKLIYVERALNSEYVNVNAILEASVSHPNLKKVSFPTLTLASIYILTGGDYISSFFKTSKQTFLKVFIENIEHICNSRVFVETIPVTHMGMEGYGVCKIDVEAWTKFVCSVYLMKHKTLFNSEPIASLHTSLTANTLTDDKVQLLKWLAYDKIDPFMFFITAVGVKIMKAC